MPNVTELHAVESGEREPDVAVELVREASLRAEDEASRERDDGTYFYLAGPMTNIPQFNFPAFDEAAALLRFKGYAIVSPAELDDEQTRETAMASVDGAPGSGTTNGEKHEDFLARDVKIVADEKCVGVICIKGWQNSRGANIETKVATMLKKQVWELLGSAAGADPVLVAVDIDDPAPPVAGTEPPEYKPGQEVRVTNATTGAEKGSKLARFDLIPFDALTTIAEVYGFGSTKYAPHNWRKGYDWGLSYAACLRHLAAFWEGEELDQESGLPHLAHAGWHCLTLLTFVKEHPELDDRFVTVGA